MNTADESKSKNCNICKQFPLTLKSVPDQGISCMRCATAMCEQCYNLSVKLYGYVGDKNLIFEQPKEESKTCMEWPYNEYYPENYGCFKTSNCWCRFEK